MRDIHDLVADSTNEKVDFDTNFEFKERIQSVRSTYGDDEDDEEDEDDYGVDDEPELADSTIYEHVIIRELLDNAETELDFAEESEDEEPNRLKWESNLEYLEHLGHSLLHGESTLYQRYTILATFYRNLWVAILLGGLVHLVLYVTRILTQGGVVNWVTIPSIIIGFLILIMLSVRWLEFRYRRLRALINDMYLISNTLGEELTPNDSDT